MTLVRNDAYGVDAVGRLLAQYRDKPRIAALLLSWVQQVQDLESHLWTVRDGLLLSTSTGYMLDLLGAIVGQDRNDMPDDVYRVWVAAKILVNKSSGTTEQILAIYRTVAAPLATVVLDEHYPAAFRLRVGNAAVKPSIGAAMGHILQLAKPIGVRGLFEFSMADPSNTFHFAESGVTENDVPYGFAHGLLSAVIEVPRPVGKFVQSPEEWFGENLLFEWRSDDADSNEDGYVTSIASTVHPEMVGSVLAQSDAELRPTIGLSGGPAGRPFISFTDASQGLESDVFSSAATDWLLLMVLRAPVQPIDEGFRAFGGIIGTGVNKDLLLADSTGECLHVRALFANENSISYDPGTWVFVASGGSNLGQVYNRVNATETLFPLEYEVDYADSARAVMGNALNTQTAVADIAYMAVVTGQFRLEQIDIEALAPWFQRFYGIDMLQPVPAFNLLATQSGDRILTEDGHSIGIQNGN